MYIMHSMNNKIENNNASGIISTNINSSAIRKNFEVFGESD